jgi:hypothetical protein
MGEVKLTARRLADDLAKDSIVTQALSRYIYQVLEVVDETRVRPLETALRAILAEPYGCRFCDSGVLRNPQKGHDADCGFFLAASALQSATADSKGKE